MKGILIIAAATVVVVGGLVLAGGGKTKDPWLEPGWHIVIRKSAARAKNTTWVAYHDGTLIAAGDTTFENSSAATQNAIDTLRAKFPDVDDFEAEVWIT